MLTNCLCIALGQRTGECLQLITFVCEWEKRDQEKISETFK